MAVQKKYLSGSGMKGKNTPLVRAGGVRQLALSIRRVNDKELSAKMREASKKAAEEIVPFVKKRVPVGNTGNSRSRSRRPLPGPRVESMQETNASPPGQASPMPGPSTQVDTFPLLGSGPRVSPTSPKRSPKHGPGSSQRVRPGYE